MRRPTISDLAQASGVSVATVDRVLNGRHPVREETARRVYDAAQAIGYHAVGLLRQRIFEDLPQYRLGFVLQKPGQAFYQSFVREIEAAAQAVTNARIKVHIDFASGVREAYVGFNNRKAGRTAAWMIARTAKRPGKVACFVGSHRFHGHELREIGFRSYFRENAPQFEVVDTLINLETAEITHEATVELLQRYPDLAGFYVCGGGMEGAISAIREERLSGKLAVVVNELTPESKAALADDVVTMVIATPLAALCKELVSLMTGALERGQAEMPGQFFLAFDIFVSEN